MMMQPEWNEPEEFSSELVLTVSEEDVGKRLDRFATEESELTRSTIAKLIDSGNVLLDGKSTSKNVIKASASEK